MYVPIRPTTKIHGAPLRPPTPVYDRLYSLAWKVVFAVSFISFAIGYLLQDTIAGIQVSDARLLAEPTQTPLHNPDPITFTRDGFDYLLTPVAEYDMAALVVHQLVYDRWYSLSRTDKAFEIDLCVMWGENMRTRAYAIPSLSITQDFRFCIFRYSGAQRVAGDAFANNHLIASDPHLRKVIRSMRAGDQVHLRGKLVNVAAKRTGEPKGRYEPANASWNTSTVRTDTGAGACEVLYVEYARILKEGNVLYRRLFMYGGYGLLACVLISIIRFVVQVVRGVHGMSRGRGAE